MPKKRDKGKIEFHFVENKEYDYRIPFVKKYGKNSLSFLTLSDSLSIF